MNVLDVYDSVRGLALDSMTKQEHAIALEARAAIAELIEAAEAAHAALNAANQNSYRARLRAALAKVQP